MKLRVWMPAMETGRQTHVVLAVAFVLLLSLPLSLFPSFFPSFFLSAGPASASPPGVPGADTAGRGRTIDEVAAVVGETPIFRSEVEQQVQMVAEQLRAAPGDTAVYNELHREVLRRLIDDELILLEARAQSMVADEAEITRAVDEAVQSNIRQLGGREDFEQQLKLEGLTEKELRERYRDEARKQQLQTRLVQKEVRSRVSLPDNAARTFFEQHRSELPKKPRQLRIQDLFIMVRADSIVEARARERAADVRRRIEQGMSFEEAVQKYSDDPQSREGGLLGRFGRDDLDGDVEQAAFSLPVGQVSEPVKSRFGFHLIRVADRDAEGAWVEIGHVLLAAPPARGDEEDARQKADSIYRQIRNGQLDFSEAIRRHSDDAESRARDGDLGWIAIENFFGEMKAVVDTLRVGRVSPPVSGDGGFHIFKVVGEQAESAYAFEEIQEEMRQYAYQAAMEEEFRTWVDGLRKKHFVDVRARW